MYANRLIGPRSITRREWLSKTSNGFGALALSTLLAEDFGLGASLGSNRTHLPAKAKNVIFCFMDGGPSHVDLFDPKPLLSKHQGEEIGKSAVSEKSQSTPDRVWLGSPWEFRQRGQSGLWVSDLFPHLAKVADEICVIRSMVGETPLHGQQNLLLHTGRITGRAPSFGAWVSYGLGSERDNLPNYLLLDNYETAFRLQTMIPELAEVSNESESTRQMYGLDSSNEYKKFYGLQCLRARRLVEAGVRCVEIACPLTHGNNSPWDQHSDLKKYHEENAMITDQGVGALIQDLKQRGLLDSTVVIWAGEMGRTPHTPKIKEGVGRDHHVNGYSIFLAGGGFKGGFAYGKTDDFGNSVVENPTSIHAVHATVLQQLGVDHEKLTFRFGGRDMRLTDVHGEIIQDILA